MRTTTRPVALLPVLLLLLGPACGGGGGGAEGPDADAADDTQVPADTAEPDAADDADAGADAEGDADADAGPPTFVLRYHRADGAYEGWTVTATGAAEGGPSFPAARVDGFGAVFEVPLADAPGAEVTYQLVNGADVDPAEPVPVLLKDAPEGAWHFSGRDAPLLRAPPAVPGPDQLVVHYLRKDGLYGLWGLHTWLDVKQETLWSVPLLPALVDDELGATFVVDLAADAKQVGLIVHKGDTKDPGPDMLVDLATYGNMVFLLTGSTEIFPYPVEVPDFSIAGARAHWIDEETVAWTWEGSASSFELRWAADGSVAVEGADVVGGASLPLYLEPEPLTAEQKKAWPHLAAKKVLRLDPADAAQIPEVLRGEIVAVARDAEGAAVDATRVQTPGVVDALFTYDGPLGLTFAEDGAPRFHLWAPTAQAVTLERFDAALAPVETFALTQGDRGVWAYEGATPAWRGGAYRYVVTVYHPATGKVETLPVTDPYSVALAPNGTHSLIVDLDDPETKPDGWDALQKPPLEAPEDIVVYEAHVRDFSAWDATVAAADRGTYLAFTYDGTGDKPLSDGMKHLRALATAGLTHLHVLPAFDVATIDEVRADRVEVGDGFDRLCAENAAVPAAACAEHGTTPIAEVLASFDPTTGDAQEVAAWMRGLDGFNWGYDPFHYNAPEGSYASDPGGVARVRDFRRMVQALADSGLRVVLDVVYNHTNSAGIGPKSVLDRVVPGYYHRLNVDTGLVETSTCCPNTATEHAMMRRLMVDSVVLWARHYKIDAFRFDLMGHHMKADMLEVRDALAALTPEADGVDGASLYVYGEGWDFGEVQGGARGVNATQLTMAGTGIGTFNDRLRDAVRGGGPFDAGEDLRANQGFATGLFTDPNEAAAALEDPKADLLAATDLIRVGMAGGVKTFRLVDYLGVPKNALLVPYNGKPGGYTQDPQELINYVSKHDNQTLFDIGAYKLPAGTSMADRARMQVVAVATTLLGQGVPFLHMGVDLLRSKSMERDSYDSGDWFNRVDFSRETTNWNVGLPSADKDKGNWPVIEDILADEAIAPAKADVDFTASRVRELLQVRKSSVLFRLRTAEQVKARVMFHNTGPDQAPGLIAMTLTDATCAGDDLDPEHDGVAVFINAAPGEAVFTLEGADGWTLHPVQLASDDAALAAAAFDDAADTFTVPGRSAVVFVRKQGAAQGDLPACNTL